MNALLPLFAAEAKADKASDIVAAARTLAPHLARSRPLDRKLVSNTMSLMFGGTDADGAWNWRDAYDAMEVALVLQIRRLAPQIARVEDAPAEIAAMLSALSSLTLTHTRRSEEQVELDQFSTPPALAAIAAAAAQIRPGDLVCEPSAGTGLLAVMAEACGAAVELNEFSPHRAALLDALFPVAPRTRHDAANLSDLITSSGSFHAVLTNPPFQYLRSHLEGSMRLLADGGRMVAIVPATVFEDKPTLAALSKAGEIVGALCFPDRAFSKHGTSVATGLLVIDRKPGGSTWSGEVAQFDTLADVAKAATELTARPTAQPRQFRQVASAAFLAPRARALATPSNKLAFLATAAAVEYSPVAWSGEGRDVGLYQAYKLSRIAFPTPRPHPSELVESGPMASVSLPPATYRPVLPAAIAVDGRLSDAQMETIIYAGEAHSRMLPGWWRLGEAAHNLELLPEGTEGAFQVRRGFFLGDGTGAGKGRQAAGMIADNMSQGRLRHVWLSKNDPLLEDARRDWTGIGGSRLDITPQSAWKQSEAIRMDRGILFTTYATLRQPARGTNKSRLDQIVDWLGPDFDGVIIFDEGHAMANAAGGGEGARGVKKPSLQGQAGLALQNRLPHARVVYVSATGATTPENLAYTSRLGLWGGPEAPFNTREDFLTAVERGGVAVMELIARELKAMGLYIARSLSFDGVEYDALTHELTPQDVEIWNDWADAFQIIHHHLQQALEATGVTDDDGKTVSAQAKSVSAFESSKLRFFSHLLSGIKAPTVIADIRRQIEAGNSPVVQIVSTNEAVMERRLAEIPPEEYKNLSIDMTPKEYVLDYLRSAFPVSAMQEIEDDQGEITLVPLRGDDGAPVLNQEALELREDLIMRLSCLPAVPGALDAIIHTLGVDVVAEVTGRSRRVVIRDGRKVLERRSASAAKSETDAYQNGTKRVLIFSDAGGTGRSYHADLNCGNQARRIHYLVEPGWRADAAIQGLGRSHRTNQAVAPLFRPVTTNIQGEKRFLSTIARRLDSLGALTRGERRTAGNGLFNADDNLESPWGRRALSIFYSNLNWGAAQCMTLAQFEDKTGLTLTTQDDGLKDHKDLPPMNTFLNRVLALRIEDQNAIFADLDAILKSLLERAAASGELDRGVEDVVTDDLKLLSEQVIRTDVVTGAETKIINFEFRTKRHLTSTAEALEYVSRRGEGDRGYFVNKQSGAAALVQFGLTFTDDADRLVKAVRLHRPKERQVISADQFKESAWTEVDPALWRATWDAEIAATDPWIVREMCLVTGLLLPIWSKLPHSDSRVRRVKAPDGRRWLGRVLDKAEVPQLLLKLGLSELGQFSVNGSDVIEMAMDGGTELALDGGMFLRKARVMDRWRLEIVNGVNHGRELKAMGAFVEIISHTARYFIPPESADIVEAVLAKWPVISVHSKAAA